MIAVCSTASAADPIPNDERDNSPGPKVPHTAEGGKVSGPDISVAKKPMKTKLPLHFLSTPLVSLVSLVYRRCAGLVHASRRHRHPA